MTEATLKRQPTLAETIENWRRIMAIPIVVAVRCVDRPDAVWKMRKLMQDTAPSDRSFSFEVPVYEWYSRYADAEDWARRPECFHVAGVYFEMNNGEYRVVLT